MCAPSLPKCLIVSGFMAFTVACVPTGINTGVSINPCGVFITPLLARVLLSSFNNVKVTAFFMFILIKLKWRLRKKKIYIFLLRLLYRLPTFYFCHKVQKQALAM